MPDTVKILSGGVVRGAGVGRRTTGFTAEPNCPMAPIGYLETGVIFCADNLDRLPEFPDECVDLVYLDPPFFSNRQYEVIWGDESEVRSFEDRWEGGIRHYIDWMRPRVAEMHRILRPTGALFLHCDSHAGHYLKVMLDDIFGQSNFRNEIIWHYKFRMMKNKRVLNRKHDTIFFYAKSEAHRIEPPIEPWTRDEIIRVRKQAIYKDEGGREWIWMPGGKGHSKNKPKYLDDIIAEGKALDDVWDMPIVTSSAKERLGYPTQKPEALLDLIVGMSSEPGGIVLDPFCGCGTTVAVAERLHRKWIGIDISPTAVRLIKRRMFREGAEVRTDGLPETEDDLRKLKHFEFQNWVIQTLHGTHAPRKTNDMGIDGYSFFERLPIQVKQSDKVGRNVVDNFETAIRRDGKHKGYVVAFSFTRGAHEEAARARAEGLEIALVTVTTLLDNPIDEPLRPNLDDLTRHLLELAKQAAARATLREAPPPRGAEELIESDLRGSGVNGA